MDDLPWHLRWGEGNAGSPFCSAGAPWAGETAEAEGTGMGGRDGWRRRGLWPLCVGGWQQDRAVCGFSPTQCNINNQKTQKAPTHSPPLFIILHLIIFFFGGIVTHDLFLYFSVGSIGSRKYNNNLYLKTKSPAAQWSCCQYQLPHWKTGSRDPGWKCKKVEKNVAKKQ